YIPPSSPIFFFFTHPRPTKIYTLSLHDALPILAQPGHEVGVSVQPLSHGAARRAGLGRGTHPIQPGPRAAGRPGSRRLRLHSRIDRKSTRLNSSHRTISYAVFCLKKKKKQKIKK